MSFDRDEQPRLRNLEPVPVVVQGRQAIALKDPLHLTDQMLCVPREFLPVLALLDGRHSLRDIQEELSRQAGQIVFLDVIEGVLQKLDEVYLLEGDRFREAFQRKVADYRKSLVRPSSHAGISYSADPQELRQELDSYFTRDGEPGVPDLFSEQRWPVGLIAPHIDLRAGGRCFAQAYHALASGQPSDIYVIFGTGHAGVEGMFTATNLDFQTPLGTVETDKEFLSVLTDTLGRDPAGEEILHASEHVIEFQVVFLQHIFSGRHEFTIVPILCSLSHHIFGSDPAFSHQREAFHEFCQAVKETCRRMSRTVCFIASADLDHVGPRYGDTFVPHSGTVSESLSKDAELLAALERIDVDGFIQGIAGENDSRRICGFSPITAMFHSMEASEGRLLGLDFANVDNRNSFVSFTSMIFYASREGVEE